LLETALGKLPSGTLVEKSSVKICCQPGRSPTGIGWPEGLGRDAEVSQATENALPLVLPSELIVVSVKTT
jgi:hypothetical protein